MVCTKMPAYFIATAHSMIIDSRGVFGSANNATCILRRGFCTSVLFISHVDMYALKCKTLGGIHYIHHALNSNQQAVYIYCACAYSASLPRVGIRLYLACFTPVAPVASL